MGCKEDWDELTAAERRVALAKDVLKQLDSNKLVVQAQSSYVTPKEMPDRYLTLSGCPRDNLVTKKDTKTIRELCTVCALGALLLSRIDKFNKLRWIDVGSPDHRWGFVDVRREHCVGGLDGAFTKSQLDLIESAFEQTSISYNYHYLKTYKAVEFGRNFGDSADRLQAIMQNIVDHNGTFKPEVEYEVTTD